jgi:hypothetical protein
MQETSAQAYGRALAVWGQWLRHWRRTRDPRVLRTALVCRQIAAEKLAVWQAELKLSQSALLAAHERRAARTVLGLDKVVLSEIRRDEQALLQALQPIADELAGSTGADPLPRWLVAPLKLRLRGTADEDA